jgi:outer membrane lipopolysaccharide assembly protein LptE/RlpB
MIYIPYRSQRFKRNIITAALFMATVLLFSACGPYTFKDVSIPPEVKTIKVNFIENRAPYKNPQLSPTLTDQLQQKISNLTRRTLVTTDNADYIISGYISSYNVSTAAISSSRHRQTG